MNKYLLMALIFVYVFILTALANSLQLGGSAVTTPSGDNLSDNPTGIISNLRTFYLMVTFQLDIPMIINTLFIAPIAIIVVFIIIDVVKDLVPFT